MTPSICERLRALEGEHLAHLAAQADEQAKLFSWGDERREAELVIMQEQAAIALNFRDFRAMLATIESQAARIAALERELASSRAQSNNARAASKRAGRDLLREEADAALDCFTPFWEPLRAIAKRAGVPSAAWLASRARDLQRRNLVESRWSGAERTSSFKLWRLKGRPVPIHASGAKGEKE